MALRCPDLFDANRAGLLSETPQVVVRSLPRSRSSRSLSNALAVDVRVLRQLSFAVSTPMGDVAILWPHTFPRAVNGNEARIERVKTVNVPRIRGGRFGSYR